MFAVMVKFRDEDGRERRGELVNGFRIMQEGVRQVIHIDQENAADVQVMTVDADRNLEIHRVPSLAIVKMKEVALA